MQWPRLHHPQSPLWQAIQACRDDRTSCALARTCERPIGRHVVLTAPLSREGHPIARGIQRTAEGEQSHLRTNGKRSPIHDRPSGINHLRPELDLADCSTIQTLQPVVPEKIKDQFNKAARPGAAVALRPRQYSGGQGDHKRSLLGQGSTRSSSPQPPPHV